MLTDVFHEVLLGRCVTCGYLQALRDVHVNSFGVLLPQHGGCTAVESDEQLRNRIAKNPRALVTRGTCNGRVVQTENHDAALAAYRVGGMAAVIAMFDP